MGTSDICGWRSSVSEKEFPGDFGVMVRNLQSAWRAFTRLRSICVFDQKNVIWTATQ